MGDTIAVRNGEEFDAAKAAAFLRPNIPQMGEGELIVEQFPSGHSNLTYLLRCGDWEGVLRRPPLGSVAPKAHDMGRESRFLTALHSLFPMAPQPYLYCADPEVIGAPFFLMERKKGVVLDRNWPPSFPQTPENARLVSERAVDTLAALHALDYRGTPLEALGRPDGYMERQVNGWIERYQRSITHEIPEAAQVAKWLIHHLPKSPAPTIVHNDFKLNNMLIASDDLAQVTAVLDWEMATLGDPLSDLAIMLSYWAEAGDSDLIKGSLTPLTALPGFLTRRELIERYAKTSGRDVEAMDFYLTFGYFKVAVILQQIYYRWKRRQTKDPRFAGMGEVVQHLMQLAKKESNRL